LENLLDVVLHPIRMRLLMALAGREMTAQQVAEIVGDVPPATLYRHLKRLAEAGVLTVVSERRVRGTLEKVYTLKPRSALLSPQELTAMSREDHLRAFTTFVASLLDDFTCYVNSDQFNLVADQAGYNKFPLELSDEEFAEASQAINAVLLPYLQNKSASGRKRRIVAMIVMPDQPASAQKSKGTPVAGRSRTRSASKSTTTR
jgi:DNA-binding transcriptional ArsR family regulator